MRYVVCGIGVMEKNEKRGDQGDDLADNYLAIILITN